MLITPIRNQKLTVRFQTNTHLHQAPMFAGLGDERLSTMMSNHYLSIDLLSNQVNRLINHFCDDK